MLKRLSVVAAAIVASCSLATAQSVSYRLLESNPDAYKPTALSLDLINCDTYLAAAAGYSVKLETVIARRLMPFISYKHSWEDLATRHIYNTYPMPKGGLRKQTVIDAGAVLFLRSKTKKRPVRVVLHSSSGGGYTYTKYVMVPSEVKRMTGIGGVFILARKHCSLTKIHTRFTGIKVWMALLMCQLKMWVQAAQMCNLREMLIPLMP